MTSKDVSIPCVWRTGCPTPIACDKEGCCQAHARGLADDEPAALCAKQQFCDCGTGDKSTVHTMNCRIELVADQVGDLLYDRCGWRPSGDAQWEKLKAGIPDLARLLQFPVETGCCGDDLTVQFPRAWAPYLQAVILGALDDFDNQGDCRWHLNELAKFLGRASQKASLPEPPHGWLASLRIGSFLKFYRGNESRFMHEHATEYADCDWVGDDIKCRSCGATEKTGEEHGG